MYVYEECIHYQLACVCVCRPAGEAADPQWSDPLPRVQVCGGQLRLQEGRQDPQGALQRV